MDVAVREKNSVGGAGRPRTKRWPEEASGSSEYIHRSAVRGSAAGAAAAAIPSGLRRRLSGRRPASYAMQQRQHSEASRDVRFAAVVAVAAAACAAVRRACACVRFASVLWLSSSQRRAQRALVGRRTTLSSSGALSHFSHLTPSVDTDGRAHFCGARGEGLRKVIVARRALASIMMPPRQMIRERYFT